MLSWVLGNPSGVFAQSLADKATARQAATEGIQAYNAGDYEKALDRLRRAQALYDAPVHLLYMARSQVKLGQLVEAAENYRLLARYQLDDGAPQAFVQAQEQGQTELADLEPRIPSLEIAVTPAVDTNELELRIDGREVSAAVIGIARPVNPGDHTVAVSGAGYLPAEGTISVAEGESKRLTLELEASPDAPPPQADGTKAEAGDEPPADAPPKKRSIIGFMGGIRLGGSIPGGIVGSHETLFGARSEVEMTDIFQTGVGFELRAGVRLADYFTPLLFFQWGAHRPNDEYDSTVDLTNNATARSGGLGLMIATPPGRIGGFGEIGLAFIDEFTVTNESSDAAQPCKMTNTFKGGALRLGGGAIFPVADFLNVTPFASLSLGQFTTVSQEIQGCEGFETFAAFQLPPPADFETSKEYEFAPDRRSIHSVFFLGVGGEFVFGPDRAGQ